MWGTSSFLKRDEPIVKENLPTKIHRFPNKENRERSVLWGSRNWEGTSANQCDPLELNLVPFNSFHSFGQGFGSLFMPFRKKEQLKTVLLQPPATNHFHQISKSQILGVFYSKILFHRYSEIYESLSLLGCENKRHYASTTHHPAHSNGMSKKTATWNHWCSSSSTATLASAKSPSFSLPKLLPFSLSFGFGRYGTCKAFGEPGDLETDGLGVEATSPPWISVGFFIPCNVYPFKVCIFAVCM